MTKFARVLNLFSVPAGNPELAGAQFKAFSRQLPLMYLILLLDTGFLSLSLYSSAPGWLTVGVSCVLGIGCVLRLVLWWRSLQRPITNEQAVHELRRTVLIATILGAAFLTWALLLHGYADVYQQAHIAFYVAFTVVGCIFCLIQLRAAALSLVLTVLPPFFTFLVVSGQFVFVAIAFNLLLVVVAMIFVLFEQSRSFAELVEMQKELVVRNAETQRLSDDFHALANLDSLTELPNRRRFFTELESCIALERDQKRKFALGLIDLDGFKPVNDLYGHATGDRVLIECGRRLCEVCGPSIFVARLGGDEFALVVMDRVDETSILALGHKVCRALQTGFAVGDIAVQISGSLGFAVCTGDTSAKLYDKADYALYQAKRRLRGGSLIFSAAHESELHDLNQIDQLLRHADLDAEMSVVFQPVFDVAQGRIKSYEALARWYSRSHGPIVPDLFIRAAERSGLIARLTPVLLRKTLTAMTELPADARVSFNLSACDVCSSETILRIVSIVQTSGIDPRRLDFEITETSIMTDFDQACEALTLLRQMGARIALDDFGAGYSSLSHIHRLPLDTIKIDRNFIADICTNETSKNIVRTVVDLSRNLGVGCIVEGVETARQVEILRGFGISDMQGFYFGRPVRAQDADNRPQAEVAA